MIGARRAQRLNQAHAPEPGSTAGLSAVARTTNSASDGRPPRPTNRPSTSSSLPRNTGTPRRTRLRHDRIVRGSVVVATTTGPTTGMQAAHAVREERGAGNRLQHLTRQTL